MTIAKRTFNVVFLIFVSTAGSLSAEKSIEFYYSMATMSFQQGYLPEARKYFTRVSTMDPQYKRTNDYLQQIKSIDATYIAARRAYAQKEYLSALTMLLTIARYYPDTGTLIDNCRKMLSQYLEIWENELISCFNNDDYETSIRLSKRIQLIDPTHEKARIYYDKSKIRKEALKKLQFAQ